MDYDIDTVLILGLLFEFIIPPLFFIIFYYPHSIIGGIIGVLFGAITMYKTTAFLESSCIFHV